MACQEARAPYQQGDMISLRNSPRLLILGGQSGLGKRIVNDFANHIGDGLGCAAIDCLGTETISRCPAAERCLVHLYQIQRQEDMWSAVESLLERKKASECVSSELAEQLHAVWWVVDDNLELELEAVWKPPPEMAEMPIVILVNCALKRSQLQAVKDRCPWATAVLPLLPVDVPLRVCEACDEIVEEGQEGGCRNSLCPMFGADVYHRKAIQGMQKLYDETVKHLPAPKSFQEDQMDQMDRLHDIDVRAQRFIQVSGALAVAAGATPVPFIEFLLLICILRTMMLDLARVYEIHLPSMSGMQLLNVPGSALGIASIMLGSLLKLHPHWSALGGLLNAIISSCFTAAIGFLFQEIFRRKAGRGEICQDWEQVMSQQEQRDFLLQQLQVW